jgi:hypothetical protein
MKKNNKIKRKHIDEQKKIVKKYPVHREVKNIPAFLQYPNQIEKNSGIPLTWFQSPFKQGGRFFGFEKISYHATEVRIVHRNF